VSTTEMIVQVNGDADGQSFCSAGESFARSSGIYAPEHTTIEPGQTGLGATTATGVADPVRPPATTAVATPDEAKATAKGSSAGQSRTKPSNGKSSSKSKPKAGKTKYLSQDEFDAELAQLENLSRLALAGNSSALDSLRSELDERPHLWRYLADLQHLIEQRMAELVAGKSPLLVEAFRKRASTFRHEILSGQPASFATKLAASRAVSCWLFCEFADLRAVKAPDDCRRGKERQRAQQSFECAMRTFMLARKADLELQRTASP
jgi:hypothetical protein